MGITLNSNSSDIPQFINGKFFVGDGTGPGILNLASACYFKGSGEFVMAGPLSKIEGQGQFIMGQGMTMRGQGTISTSFYANATVSADVSGGTLEINSPTVATLTHGLAVNGGKLLLSAPAVEGISNIGPDMQIITTPTILEARAGSEVIITTGTQLKDPKFIKSGGGVITIQGDIYVERAAFNGDYPMAGTLVVTREVNLAGSPAGRLIFTGDPTQDHGFAYLNDFNGDLVSDGPTVIKGGEIVLNDTYSSLRPLRTWAASGSHGVRLEGATVRGRGDIDGHVDLSTFDSQLIADNPSNALAGDQNARTLYVRYFNVDNPGIENAGVVGATNGGYLLMEGLTLNNKSDGGVDGNGVPHQVGFLLANPNSHIQMNGCELHHGAVNVAASTSSFSFLSGKQIGGTNDVIAFNGPGRMEINGSMTGQLFATAGSTVHIEEVYFSGNYAKGDLLLNGPGRFILNGTSLTGSGLPDSDDTLTLNGTMDASGRLYNLPIHIRPNATMSALRMNDQILNVSTHILNEGLIIAGPGDFHRLLVEQGGVIENVNSGHMIFQGEMHVSGTIKGGLIEAFKPLRSYAGTLENVTINKLGNPTPAVEVATMMTLRGTIYNNAIMHVEPTTRIELDGPVVLDNQDNLFGRVELPAGAYIDDTDDSDPTLTVGPRQTILARRTAEQAGGSPGDYSTYIYVPVHNNGTIIADAMVLKFQKQPSGKGRYSVINGGELHNLSPWNSVGVFWEQTVQVVSGLFKLDTTNGMTIRNATIGADLPAGLANLGVPAGASIVAVGGGNIVANGGGNIVANGGGNIVANGGGNIVANGGGNIVANGGGNIVANGGGNIVGSNAGAIVANGGGNIVANGGGNIVAIGGGNIVGSNAGAIVANGGGNIIANGGGNFTGGAPLARAGGGIIPMADPTPTDAKDLAHLYVGRNGSVEAPAVQMQNNSVFHLTDIPDGGNPPEAPNNTTTGTVIGNFQLEPGSEMQIQIGSRAVGGHDQLHVTGTGTLAGRLNVWFLNAFHQQINAADVFTIVTTDTALTPSFTNLTSGRVQTSDGRGSFAVVTSIDGKSLLLQNYQPASVPPWQAWLTAKGLPTNADPLGNPDGDSLPNVLEFSRGTHPTTPDAFSSSGATLTLVDGVWEATFRRYPAERSVLIHGLEMSTNNTTWTPLGSPATVKVRHVNDQTEEVITQVPAAQAGGKLFIRSRSSVAP